MIIVLGCSTPENDENNSEKRTPLEKSGFTKLTTNVEIDKYLSEINTESAYIKSELIDTTPSGRKIFLTKISKYNDESDKLKVFIIAQQHGNEPSGKEGVLLLINSFAKDSLIYLLDSLDIFILPQANPDGSDMNKRRTADNIDMNRDHVLMKAPETRAIQKIYNKFLPHVTVDIHEYNPYRKSWIDFGYIRQFDEQFGCVTNPNIDRGLYYFSKKEVVPFIRKYINSKGFSFFEYTLGFLPENERFRHSTVDINDGRQSFGIQHSLSFIIEGLNGKDSIYNIERRARGQHTAALALLEFCYNNKSKIEGMVKSARHELTTAEEGEKVSVRADHFKGDRPLQYPVLSLKTNKDTVFTIAEYHSVVKSLHDITKPKTYLVPASDSKLITLLKKHQIVMRDYKPDDKCKIYQYKIIEELNDTIEGRGVNKLIVEKHSIEKITPDNYIEIPVNQLKSNTICLLLEPQSSIGLVTYSEFEYLYKKLADYPVLRVECGN